mmetsp:Transcript_145732/g.466975  ORF Transcript_145732/g.466975 Transcript_145732/m.466975 type:complete len:102 (-) Transcript_145732:849-1154(-)
MEGETVTLLVGRYPIMSAASCAAFDLSALAGATAKGDAPQLAAQQAEERLEGAAQDVSTAGTSMLFSSNALQPPPTRARLTGGRLRVPPAYFESTPWRLES